MRKSTDGSHPLDISRVDQGLSSSRRRGTFVDSQWAPSPSQHGDDPWLRFM